MILPKDKNFIQVDIERQIGGSLDQTSGSWIDAETILIAEAEIDIQPRSGNMIDVFKSHEYINKFIGFIDQADINFQPGFFKIKQGDIIEGKYEIVDIRDWQTHLELILEVR